MSEEHSEEDIFLTPEIDPFKDNPILNIKFSVNKGSQTDKKLINYFYSKTIGKKNSDNNVQTLKTTVNELMSLINCVAESSINVREANTTFIEGDKEDHIKLDIDFEQKPNYFILPLFGMYLHPNFTFAGYNYSSYPKSSLFKYFDATQVRVGYGTKKSVSFHQFFKTYKEIDTEYLEELSSRNLGMNVREIKRESALIFRQWINKPSILFPFHGFADASSCYYFKFGYKRRRNDVDTNKASAELLKIALNQDKMLELKLGYSSSEFTDPSFQNGSTTTEISAEYNSDSLNSKFVHMKAHFRKFFSVGKLLMQSHAKFDKIIPLTNSDDIMLNDRILLRNFKGIKDVGKKHYKHAEEKETAINRLPVGDCIGHLSSLELGLKITSSDLPLFKMYQVENISWTLRPFIFTNIALLPEDMKSGQSLMTNIKDNVVASAGFGIQLIHSLACLELYYSTAVYKHKYEFGTEIQFNFGID